MAETMKKTMWWWPWQTEKVEAMLEKMAAEGWVLVSAGGACTSFMFQRAEPARVRYCLDYQEKEKPEYLAILNDDGWKMAYRGSGWYIWSKQYSGDRPALYTDHDSLVRRNTAILGSLTAVLATQIPLAVVMLDDIAARSPFAMVLLIIWGLVVAILAGVTIGTALGNRKLRQRAGNGGR